MGRRLASPSALSDGAMPFSWEGFTVIRGEFPTKRSPVGGNRRIPICLYCGTRHKLQKRTKAKREQIKGITVEYDEDWYYCEEAKLPFKTRQMEERNLQRRDEAYERFSHPATGNQKDSAEE